MNEPIQASSELADGDSVTSETKTCPRCAETVKAAAAVCRYCQYEFEPRPASSPDVTARPAGSRLRRIGLGVVVFLVLVAGAFAFIRVTSLSDAELVWCRANIAEVGVMADSLALPVPPGWPDWRTWGMAADEGTLGVSWDNKAYLPASEQSNRDRACRAAYQVR